MVRSIASLPVVVPAVMHMDVFYFIEQTTADPSVVKKLVYKEHIVL